MKRISETEMVKKTGALIGIDAVENFDMLSAYLDLAESKILNRQYPFGVPDGTEVEERYQQVQIEIAIFLYNKRGAEGESGHTENGVTRSYGGSTDVPPELLAQITPYGMVV